MRRIGTGIMALLAVLTLALGLALPAGAQDLGARARLAGPVTVEAGWRNLSVGVPLSQPVPWRTRLLSDPPRAVVDFRTLDWAGFDPQTVPVSGAAVALRVGSAGAGWTRLVIELDRPMGFAEAGMATDPVTGGATLALTLAPMSDTAVAAQASALAATDGAPSADILRAAAGVAPLGQRPTLVVLDPGHGGVDPGAIRDGVTEASITLAFARELAEALARTGRYQVVLTRDDDVFVSLEGRITVAHTVNADLFVSLHADALEDGEAVGATVYTLAEGATDAAAEALAERHDRDDMAGRRGGPQRHRFRRRPGADGPRPGRDPARHRPAGPGPDRVDPGRRHPHAPPSLAAGGVFGAEIALGALDAAGNRFPVLRGRPRPLGRSSLAQPDAAGADRRTRRLGRIRGRAAIAAPALIPGAPPSFLRDFLPRRARGF